MPTHFRSIPQPDRRGRIPAVEGMFEEGKVLIPKSRNSWPVPKRLLPRCPAPRHEKAIVMAGISVFVTTLSTSWDAVKDLVSAFIDSVVQTYNTVTAVAAPSRKRRPGRVHSIVVNCRLLSVQVGAAGGALTAALGAFKAYVELQHLTVTVPDWLSWSRAS